MSQFRNVSADERAVVYGVPRAQTVAPDAVLVVDDACDEAYACQPDIWQPVTAATATPAINPGPAPAEVAAPAE